MTQQTEREKFEAWAEAFDGTKVTRDGEGYRYVLAQTYWDAWQARAALEAKQAVQWPEPVATLHCNGEGYVHARASDAAKNMRFENPVSLYTEQQVRAMLQAAQSAPVLQPLTDEQIEAMPVWHNFIGLFPEARKEIARAIEHAHEIT